MLIALDWPMIFQDFIVAIIAGICVSFAFIFLLLKFFKPKFEISPYICYTGGKYRFKMVNKSIYHAFDAQIELFEMEPYPHSNGRMNVNIKPINLQTRNITIIPRYHSGQLASDPYDLYSMLCLTEENLQAIFGKKGVYLEMNLTVRHGLTGLAATFVQKFGDIDSIKHGHKFCFGSKTDTMAENLVA